MKTLLTCLLFAVSTLTAQADAQDQAVGELGKPGTWGNGGTWKFLNGGEFPGAAGKLGFPVVDGRTVGVVIYDFSRGGRYVTAYTKTHLGEEISEVRFKVKSEQTERIAVRLKDSSGQYHQFSLAYSTPGEWQTLRQPVAGTTSPIHFQGNNDGIIVFPVVEFWLMVNSRSGDIKAGEVLFSDVKALR